MIAGETKNNAKIVKKRNANIDLLRLLLAFFVVLIHTRSVEWFAAHEMINALWLPLIYTCNSGFFILSGYFALNFKRENGIKNFYINKVRNLLIPWIIYSFIVYLWEKIYQKEYLSFGQLTKNFFIDFLTGGCAGHFWFMYTLFGMLLAAPFLAIMFQNLNKRQSKLLFLLATINLSLLVILSDIGKNYSFSFFLGGMDIYFFTGILYSKPYE